MQLRPVSVPGIRSHSRMQSVTCVEVHVRLACQGALPGLGELVRSVLLGHAQPPTTPTELH